jgi:hypothetical protein
MSSNIIRLVEEEMLLPIQRDLNDLIVGEVK